MSKHGYEAGRLNLPFVGISTFGKRPYVEDWDAIDADVAVMGAPFDFGTQWRSGARFGPRPPAGARVARYPQCCQGRTLYCCAARGRYCGRTGGGRSRLQRGRYYRNRHTVDSTAIRRRLGAPWHSRGFDGLGLHWQARAAAGVVACQNCCC